MAPSPARTRGGRTIWVSVSALLAAITGLVVQLGVANPEDTAEAEPPPPGPHQPGAATRPKAPAESATRQPRVRTAGPDGRIRRLRGPNLDRWLLKHDERLAALQTTKEPGTSSEALALYYRADLFGGASKKSAVLGMARRGARIPVKKRVYGSGCNGRWYLVQGDGYVCTANGFRVGKEPEMDLYYSLPDLSELLPYLYGKVTRKAAERLYRIPTREEDEAIVAARKGEKGFPEVVEKAMKGIYFLAIDHEETSDNRSFYCTARGRFVRKENVELRSTPRMYGEWLTRPHQLPLVFVYDKDRPLYRLRQGKLTRIGVAEKHARFWLRGSVKHGGRSFVRAGDDLVVESAHVRIVRRVPRPEDVSSKEKWIHVHLPQQTLVAYEGDTPVFATLVSSGKKGFEPPAGLFQIHKKFVSTTMNGPDPDDGWYEVEEVPWTMYYWESYALHGTYWHNDFGKPRSHGCTNISPADSKWLFHWTDPQVPYAWHSREKNGTKVFFTK